MSTIFSECINLKFLDVSNFNTSEVTNMERIFKQYSRVEILDVSTFIITSEVEDMKKMFIRCPV